MARGLDIASVNTIINYDVPEHIRVNILFILIFLQ